MNQHSPCIFIGLFFHKCILTPHLSLQCNSAMIWRQVSPSPFSWRTLFQQCWSLGAGLSDSRMHHSRAFALAAPMPGNAHFLNALTGFFRFSSQFKYHLLGANFSDHSSTPPVTFCSITLCYVLYST